MAEKFRDCFVGEKGYDALKKLMKSGNDFCTDVAKCLQERSDAEIAYAKALRKNSDACQKFAGRSKGTLSQAFAILATETSKESEAHSSFASTLFNDISMSMKNLADAQTKDRKSIEDTLNGKFKEWNAQKELDNKYRSRQFEKCKEIETLILRISELSTAPKNSVKSKGSTLPTPLACVLPAGRHTSASDKLESSIQKAEEELEKAERKYHNSTKDVELARQACDAEMCRSCDQIEKMELDRISKMANFIQIYADSIQTLSRTMHEISQNSNSIQILPDQDIIVQARSNAPQTEIEILLYDIYAENENNVMNEQRRILSLKRWIDMLKEDIAAQKKWSNANLSSLPSAPPHKSVEDDSPDDDRFSSSDGAMCATSTDIVRNAGRHRDGSSSSSNDDDDGAMYRGKREKKKKEGAEKFSSEKFIDRQNIHFLKCLYEASLFKIESVYNRIKHLRELQYEYVDKFAQTYNDKGYPTTLLRLPFQPSTHTPPSAPSAVKYFIETAPVYPPLGVQQQPFVYAIQKQAPPVGWAVDQVQRQYTAPDNPMVASGPPYPVLKSQPPVHKSQPQVKHVRALHHFKAKHKDELDLQPGDIIMLHERRNDGWCEGNLNGRIGLFPGNHTEEIIE